MRYKVMFAAGFGAGYVFGARAGRARYEQIMRAVRGFKDSPAVQETAGVLQARAVDVLDGARRAVSDTVASKVGGHGGPDTGTRYPAGTTTPSAGANGDGAHH